MCMPSQFVATLSLPADHSKRALRHLHRELHTCLGGTSQCHCCTACKGCSWVSSLRYPFIDRGTIFFMWLCLGGYCSVREKVIYPSVHVAVFLHLSSLWRDLASRLCHRTFPDHQRRRSCLSSFGVHFEFPVWVYSVGLLWCSYFWSQPGMLWWYCCVRATNSDVR